MRKSRLKLGGFSGFAAAAAFTAALVPGSAAIAQNFTVLHSFAGGTTDGANPRGSLILSGNLLYGMTYQAGANGYGAIIAYDPTANVETLVYSFTGNGDGEFTTGSLVASGTNLYGMGPYAAFSYNTANNTEASLHKFFGSQYGDGIDAQGSLIQSGSLLYGLTSGGGTGSAGTIFSINPSTKVETVLYSFPQDLNDGYGPMGSLIQSGNYLYGMSETGGVNNGDNGFAFSYNTSTNTEAVLHSFQNSDGANPTGSFIMYNNLLYGETAYGGTGAGVIFSLNPTTKAQNVLYDFGSGPTGASQPLGSLIQANGILYGMTSGGGANGDGTIFSFNPSTSTLTVLYSFSGLDGSSPRGDLLISGDTLYGMTIDGGANGDGVIFSLALPEPGGFLSIAACALASCGRRSRPRLVERVK